MNNVHLDPPFWSSLVVAIKLWIFWRISTISELLLKKKDSNGARLQCGTTNINSFVIKGVLNNGRIHVSISILVIRDEEIPSGLIMHSSFCRWLRHWGEASHTVSLVYVSDPNQFFGNDFYRCNMACRLLFQPHALISSESAMPLFSRTLKYFDIL